MTSLLSNIQDENLLEAFWRNLVEYFNHLCESGSEECKFVDDKVMAFVRSNIPSPMLNSIILKDTNTKNLDTQLRKIQDYFQDFLGPYQLWMKPGLSKEIDAQLKSNKYRFVGDSNGLAIELDKMEHHDSPNSLYVQPVRDKNDFDKWVEIASYNLNLREDGKTIYNSRFKERDFKDLKSNSIKYLGWLNAEAIACSTLILGGGVVGVYDDTIIPRLKRTHWGIEESMVSVPLKQAMTSGYKVGVVHSSVGDLRRYRAFGFKERFKFPRYIFSPPR
ncbi:MAG: hypothetical protein ACW98K_14255 [Candidatus Kariarchaeaceae archaeon]|jgi:hypothetical protein